MHIQQLCYLPKLSLQGGGNCSLIYIVSIRSITIDSTLWKRNRNGSLIALTWSEIDQLQQLAYWREWGLQTTVSSLLQRKSVQIEDLPFLLLILCSMTIRFINISTDDRFDVSTVLSRRILHIFRLLLLLQICIDVKNSCWSRCNRRLVLLLKARKQKRTHSSLAMNHFLPHYRVIFLCWMSEGI